MMMDTFPSQNAIIFAWLLCSCIMFNIGTCSLKIRCNQEDKRSLLNFKQGVVDPSNMLSTWSTEPDCCAWIGVKCDSFTSRVTELSLRCFATRQPYNDKVDKSHCLTGSIHLISLLELEFLSHLDFKNNDFLSIRFDSIDSNNCSNPFVSKCVNSSVLHYLDLSKNEDLVIDNLQWLSRTSSLEFLDLGDTNLHKVTNWLQLVTMLPSLSMLMLHGCQLEDMSPSLQFVNFTSLQVLDLSYNKFGPELPKWLFNLSCDILAISLDSNSLRGQLPKAFPNFPYLEALWLKDNLLDGPIPDWFGQLEHLKRLALQGNQFSGSIPINLGNASSLVDLNIAKNPLTGVVSERNFAKLSMLKVLGIYSPTLSFDFDSHWIPPFQLQILLIGHVGPKLPAWIYTQRSIEYLTIYDSIVSFETQDRFWNFVSGMEYLDLQDNSIDGDMSNVLLNSTFIVLSRNNMKGGLPQLSSNVVVIDMSNNSLSGSIFPLLCDHKMMNGKTNLMYLDISNNHLTGGLTNCWKKWKSLLHINLGTNNLTGNIPQSIGFLSNLTSLHLHENMLFGEIPSSLQNCQSLLVLNVRENKLSGNIPSWIAQNAKVLQLRSNQFNGNIPPQICQKFSLIILDFGDNRISGRIPKCLNNMIALISNNATLSKLSFYFDLGNHQSILVDNLELVTKGQGLEYGQNLHFMSLVDLSSNDLSGTIPPQMFSLTGLHSLNLSHNKLMGGIPKEIGNMQNLESLDFSSNNLSGEIPQSLSNLSFLSYLNLSVNDFKGKIPSGTQLQGFSALSYIGNPDLCGLPLTKNCSHDDKSEDTKPIYGNKDKSEFLSWFYIGIESGFVTGFLGVCSVIFLSRKWRHAYFNFLYDLRDRLCVIVVIKMNSMFR